MTYARAGQHPQSPTKARIFVPDATYDLEDVAAILNSINSTFAACLDASMALGYTRPGQRPKKPINTGVETGLKRGGAVQ